MPETLQRLLSSDGFMPHGMCYVWRPGIMGLHLVTDGLIGLAYISISASLAYLVFRSRREIPFRAMFIAFGLFIVACGATHLMAVWTVWQPVYWASGGVKMVTALASVATAIALPPLIPVALRTLHAARISETRAQDVEHAHAQLEQAHAELRRREQQLAEAQHIARLGSWEWDMETNQVRWSDQLYRNYGLEPGSVDVTYDLFLERVHPRDRARVAALVEHAVKRREAFAFDHDIVRPDGSEATLHARGDLLLDDDGRPVRMVGTGQDISERREAEEGARRLVAEQAARAEAEQSAHRMAFLANASTVLTSSLDYEETLTRIARLMVPVLGDYCVVDLLEEEHGYRRVAAAHADPTKRELLEKARPFGARAELWAHPVVQAVRTGEPVHVKLTQSTLEGMGLDAAQHETILQLGGASAMAIPFDAWGRIAGAILVVNADPLRSYDAKDVLLARELGRRAGLAVDNARLYRDTQEANRTKSSFLAAMSHELRTPLNAVVGYADLLESGIGGALSATQTTHVKRIKASAWHLLGLIEEILTYARVEAGREQPRFEPIDVREVAGEALALIEPAAAQKRLPLRLSIPEELPSFLSDRVKLRQILTNLLSNAVKFTKDGEVQLAVNVGDGTIEFSVSDTGVGIAPEHLRTIFEPFRQVDEDRTRRAQGTGLGLTVSQRLTQMLGGEIEVESSLDGGSVFRVVLPLRAAA